MAWKKSMPVTINATTAHRQFGNLVKRAFSGKEHFIVEKEGLPVVAIMSMREYEELMSERDRNEEEKQARLKQFREAARAIGEEVERRGLSEEDVDAIVEKVRQRRYEQKHVRKPAK